MAERDDEVTVPFPTSPVSNMEWCPRPATRQQRLAAKLIAEECVTRAKRHGMTRAQFLRTAAATTTAFMVFNKVYGLPQTGEAAAMPVSKEQCDDLDAARELLDRDLFVMDVQQHHVDLNLPNAAAFCFLRFRDKDVAGGCPQNLGQMNFVKEVFIDSETDVGVISGLPYSGVIITPDAMADTRDLVNQLAGSQRCLAQAVCDPRTTSGPTSIESLAHQVNDRNVSALKCYTYSGNWRLDDETVAYPMFEQAQNLGLRLINVHKGLPATFAPGSPEFVRTTDFPKAVNDWPKLRFCAYHSGYFEAGDHPEGLDGITEFVQVIASITPNQRRRVYAEIGSTFAITYLSGGDQAAHFIGQLLKSLGSRNVLWGTDSIWWGSPQWLIDAFKVLQIPAPMQEQFGYPALTDKVKRRIFGLNAARLYGVRPKAKRCTVPPDSLAQIQASRGGPRPGRRLVAYGPRTRREFFALLRAEGRARA
jgi:predicted TIM-barrel fold metal-dependent hydrolase